MGTGQDKQQKEQMNVADIFSAYLSSETKKMWQQYEKENDPYERVIILEKIVKVNLKSSLAEYEKMKRQ